MVLGKLGQGGAKCNKLHVAAAGGGKNPGNGLVEEEL